MVVGMGASPAWGLPGVVACPLAGDAYSNPPDQLPHGAGSSIAFRSDTNGPDFLVVESADIAATGGVTGVCWWGMYLGPRFDCGAVMPGDDGNSFTINYYNNDAGGMLPGSVRAGPFAVGDGSPTQTGLTVTSSGGNVFTQWLYVASHPTVQVTAGEKLWVEIFNNTTADCIWFWETAPTMAEGGAGDGMSVVDLNANGVYELDEVQDVDFGLSLSLDVCPWDCDGGNDGLVSINDFLKLLAQWGTLNTCDFDGGGVGITDFLALLANWGPCP